MCTRGRLLAELSAAAAAAAATEKRKDTTTVVVSFYILGTHARNHARTGSRARAYECISLITFAYLNIYIFAKICERVRASFVMLSAYV